ncbi:MAG: hypothetical protein ACOCRV_02300, partial [bacterium]
MASSKTKKSKNSSKMSNLLKNERRLAYKLLLPTLIVLLLVAVYPLFQVFYTSFTDRKFASAQQTQFVGLDNYISLLGIKIRQLPAQVDQETGDVILDEETGNIV